MNPRPSPTIERLNTVLLFLALGGLLFYVVTANSLTAQAWHTADAQDQLTTILDERNDLIDQRAAFEDRARLAALARRVGMVPAEGIVYLMDDQSVAAR